MRLFIAINFNKETKEKILKVQKDLIGLYSKGNPTKIENIHLTLIFLGEIEKKKLPPIKNIMDGIKFSNLNLVFDKIGKFNRRNGDIYWLGIEENKKLLDIQNKLYKDLLKENFILDKKPFSPHITLARKVVMPSNEKQILSSKFSTNINHLSLMESQIIDRKVSYKEIYRNNN
ncbi:RNA 2',3'-cyclic phosphodiesterase [Miniphocaeibacter halophilus]|uniref:RNA 2',3'-cyclic phosphodiesterase n=1 Tax=Miniphocaeibacter halophilus TaxID=2931922 RepID=A0AC61N1U5_9FIRM|nr:RNA 2',3'-cyclic phosphodiesterase [Miniphocaeibacter halophilus]QQK08929.1 RNA 2',3'-cyclic phosphodiesterase [Miniphocaeibacter halophilus]